jgi:hypothetical protein
MLEHMDPIKEVPLILAPAIWAIMAQLQLGFVKVALLLLTVESRPSLIALRTLILYHSLLSQRHVAVIMAIQEPLWHALSVQVEHIPQPQTAQHAHHVLLELIAFWQVQPFPVPALYAKVERGPLF